MSKVKKVGAEVRLEEGEFRLLLVWADWAEATATALRSGPVGEEKGSIARALSAAIEENGKVSGSLRGLRSLLFGGWVSLRIVGNGGGCLPGQGGPEVWLKFPVEVWPSRMDEIVGLLQRLGFLLSGNSGILKPRRTWETARTVAVAQQRCRMLEAEPLSGAQPARKVEAVKEEMEKVEMEEMKMEKVKKEMVVVKPDDVAELAGTDEEVFSRFLFKIGGKN